MPAFRKTTRAAILAAALLASNLTVDTLPTTTSSFSVRPAVVCAQRMACVFSLFSVCPTPDGGYKLHYKLVDLDE
ncbi:MAG: hypothetical protein F4139_09255 [Gemmatimonadetes bacterium]|nr:hypothetical protein [Gemmatimonadota bacterium]MYH53125.1 hypothetical protein [Gemmatimonadota bacterium]MYK66942.1 hypothetical protein [Gemmatimonadota bacterium]